MKAFVILEGGGDLRLVGPELPRLLDELDRLEKLYDSRILLGISTFLSSSDVWQTEQSMERGGQQSALQLPKLESMMD